MEAEASREDVQQRAAALAADHAWKEIIRLMKADILRTLVNEHDRDKRDALFHDIQAVGRLEAKVASLASDGVIAQRKDEAAKRRRPGGKPS